MAVCVVIVMDRIKRTVIEHNGAIWMRPLWQGLHYAHAVSSA